MMPLKNPAAISAIPKTKGKTISKIKEAIPERKKSEIEYICRVYFYSDKAKEVQKYCISLSTVRRFSALNYEISVKAVKEKNIIDISILGLQTRADYVNEAGPAECALYFENLFGKQTINIIKQDGGINSALIDFNIFKKQIELVKIFLPGKKNNRKFCNFEVANNKFTYALKGVR